MQPMKTMTWRETTSDSTGFHKLNGRFRSRRDTSVALCGFAAIFTLATVSLVSNASRTARIGGPPVESPIRFAFRPIDFRLDTSETLERHEPEAMGGGVAVILFYHERPAHIIPSYRARLRSLAK